MKAPGLKPPATGRKEVAVKLDKLKSTSKQLASAELRCCTAPLLSVAVVMESPPAGCWRGRRLKLPPCCLGTTKSASCYQRQAQTVIPGDSQRPPL